MYGLDSRLITGFRTYFLDYSKLQERTATRQCKVLQAMLQAALCAETEFNNIKTIASEVYGGGGQAFPVQVYASQCKKTMTRYGCGDEGTNKSNSTSGHLPLCCYGCGGLHPWLVLENSIYVIKCPQAGDAHIAKNARRTINRIQAKRKKQQQESKKRKNLATNAASMCSSITGITGATSTTSAGAGCGCGRGKPIVFLYDAQVLQTETHRPVLPVAIQSMMPHITLLLGTDLDCSNYPSIQCVVDIAAALYTGNYHFFSLLLQSGTPTVLPRSSFPKIILPSFFWVSSRMIQGPSQLISPWRSSSTCPTLQRWTPNILYCCYRTPSECEHGSWSPIDHSHQYDYRHRQQRHGSKAPRLSPIQD